MGQNHPSPRHSRPPPTPRPLAPAAVSDRTVLAAQSADPALYVLARLLAVAAAREAFANAVAEPSHGTA